MQGLISVKDNDIAVEVLFAMKVLSNPHEEVENLIIADDIIHFKGLKSVTPHVHQLETAASCFLSAHIYFLMALPTR